MAPPGPLTNKVRGRGTHYCEAATQPPGGFLLLSHTAIGTYPRSRPLGGVTSATGSTWARSDPFGTAPGLSQRLT